MAENERLFGQVAIVRDLITREQLTQALEDQRAAGPDVRGKPLGEILAQKGIIKDDDIHDVLRHQNYLRIAEEGKRFGALGIRAGVVNENHVLDSLKEQEKLFLENDEVRRLGDVLVDRGYLTPRQMTTIDTSLSRGDFDRQSETQRLKQAIDLKVVRTQSGSFKVVPATGIASDVPRHAPEPATASDTDAPAEAKIATSPLPVIPKHAPLRRGRSMSFWVMAVVAIATSSAAAYLSLNNTDLQERVASLEEEAAEKDNSMTRITVNAAKDKKLNQDRDTSETERFKATIVSLQSANQSLQNEVSVAQEELRKVRAELKTRPVKSNDPSDQEKKLTLEIKKLQKKITTLENELDTVKRQGSFPSVTGKGGKGERGANRTGSKKVKVKTEYDKYAADPTALKNRIEVVRAFASQESVGFSISFDTDAVNTTGQIRIDCYDNNDVIIYSTDVQISAEKKQIWHDLNLSGVTLTRVVLTIFD